jgi:hypothetical protein
MSVGGIIVSCAAWHLELHVLESAASIQQLLIAVETARTYKLEGSFLSAPLPSDFCVYPMCPGHSQSLLLPSSVFSWVVHFTGGVSD